MGAGGARPCRPIDRGRDLFGRIDKIAAWAPHLDIKRDAERTGQDVETITKMGQEATEFVRELVQQGEKVILEFDVQERDKYGRLLGYVLL